MQWRGTASIADEANAKPFSSINRLIDIHRKTELVIIYFSAMQFQRVTTRFSNFSISLDLSAASFEKEGLMGVFLSLP